MKICVCLVSLFAVLCVGCGVELLTTTAIQSELQAKQAGALKRQVGNAAESTGKIRLQRAIDTYAAEKGHYPATLDELVPGHLPALPTHTGGAPYGYDPATGKVLDTPVSAPANQVTANDHQKMNQIRTAIDSYGMATGYYPPSLQALVPTYLAVVPKTDSGQDFIFYPQNGALLHPVQLARQTQPGYAPARPAPPRQTVRSGGAGVGGGPMAEVMTGVGVQQQLNSMSNAGANSAGGYSRRKLGNITEQRNKQQEKALNNLGF